MTVAHVVLLVAAAIIVAEWAVIVGTSAGASPWRQFLSDLACGAVRIPFEYSLMLVLVVPYELVYRARFITLPPDHVSTWIIAFLGYEFTYYWSHRLSHSIPALWAVHAVHHQGNQFNFALSVRLGALAPFLNFPFYATIALLGVPFAPLAVVLMLSTIPQILIHSHYCGSLGVAEKIINTPACHRVHHSVDPELSNHNFGSVLMIWDRMFGSWRSSASVPAEYRSGLSPMVPAVDPITANRLPIQALIHSVRERPTLGGKLLAIFGPAGPRRLASMPARRSPSVPIDGHSAK